MHPAAKDPWREVLQNGGAAALAVISAVDGPAYRDVGTAMAFFADGRRFGALTAGCIEEDVALHARSALADGRVRKLRYGEGSPFFDLKLPCGGGLEIMVLPSPDLGILRELEARRERREPTSLWIGGVGELSLLGSTDPDALRIHFVPPTRFLIFGTGPEAIFFTDLVRATGAAHCLYTPEEATLTNARAAGCTCEMLGQARLPSATEIDAQTAVLFFFHDHFWEPPILNEALKSCAFYIGAQGSRRTHQTRIAAMERLGWQREELVRLRGPIGLIRSVRDPRVLAVSVLAEVMAVADALATEQVGLVRQT